MYFEDLVFSQKHNLTNVSVVIDKASVNPCTNLAGGEDLLISIKPTIVLAQVSVTR